MADVIRDVPRWLRAARVGCLLVAIASTLFGGLCLLATLFFFGPTSSGEPEEANFFGSLFLTVLVWIPTSWVLARLMWRPHSPVWRVISVAFVTLVIVHLFELAQGWHAIPRD